MDHVMLTTDTRSRPQGEDDFWLHQGIAKARHDSAAMVFDSVDRNSDLRKSQDRLGFLSFDSSAFDSLGLLSFHSQHHRCAPAWVTGPMTVSVGSTFG